VSEHAFTAGTTSPRRLDARAELPSVVRALGVALLCLLGAAAVWVVAQYVPAAHLRDAIALRDFMLLSHPQVDAVGNFLIHLLEPPLFVIWGTALVTAALVRGRPRVAVAVASVMALAPLTAEMLKPLLARPHAQVGAVHITPASWPSGHATAGFTLVLCAVLVAPARLRVLTAVLGALYAAALGCSLLILGWHMPSDVLGGYLLAALWMALAVAIVSAADRRWPPRRGQTPAPQR
jgi:membrane-associated phospholipid phosphatase